MRRLLSILFIICVFAVTYSQNAAFYEKYAQKGDPEAMYNLANCYLSGTDGTEQNSAKAAEWMAKAVKKKYAPAQVMMGKMYEKGVGVLMDTSMALSLYQKAAEQKYVPALFALGCYYMNQGNAMESKRYFDLGCSKGDGDCQYFMGYYYMYGNPGMNINVDYKTAAYYLTEASKNGNGNAATYLGLLYENGQGVDEDMKMAVSCYKYGVESDIPLAHQFLANCYMYGKGVDVNLQEAYRLNLIAAENELGPACKALGDQYYYGGGVAADGNEAAKWYQKAVDLEESSAASMLGMMYVYGIGVSQDYTKGLTLLKKAVDNRDNLGEYTLGNCYYYGYGVKQDYNQAFVLFKDAVQDGNTEAMINLAVCWYNGYGTDVDKSKAFKLATEAAEAGEIEAFRLLGYYYAEGAGCEVNYTKASENFLRAAEGGSCYALAVVGLAKYEGSMPDLFAKDQNGAFQYLSAIINNNEFPSLDDDLKANIYKDLGACYRFGRGTEVNQSLASYYTAESAKYGDTNSKNAMKYLMK